MRESVSGQVTADPLTTAQGRVSVRIAARKFAFEGGHAVSDHGLVPLSSYSGALGTVSLRDGRQHVTEGSAIIVSPAFAVTAKHVVSDWIEAMRKGEATAVCQAPTNDTLHLWEVESISALSSADLAVLSLRLRSALPPSFGVAHVSARMPAVGESVYLCGFTAHKRSTPHANMIEVEGNMRVCTGRIVDVWPRGRDRVMIPSPSFAVDCPAFSGMSGGPVFDQYGYVIGVVSSGTDGDQVAFVSHIWPALVARIEPRWLVPPSPTTLLHLGKRWGISIDRADAFRVGIRNGVGELMYDEKLAR